MKKWKELSAEEKQQYKQKNPGGKASYKAQQMGLGNATEADGSTPLSGMKIQSNKSKAGMKQYDDTSDGYKNKVTRNQHQTKLAKREAANKGVEAPASLKQYDPSSLGNDKINKKDIRFLMSKEGGGYSAKQINKYLKNQNVEAGGLAQNMLNKRLQEVNPKTQVTDITESGDESKPVVNTDPSTPTPSPAPAPTPSPAPAPTPSPAPTPTPAPTPSIVGKVETGDSFDRTFTGPSTGDINNSQVDLSQRDYSVNIAGSAGNDLSNMASAAAYGGLNELDYQKSQDMMSGSSRANDAIKQAEKLTGATERITDLTNTTNATPDYYSDLADAQLYKQLGDTFNFQLPNWNPVKPPKQNEFDPAKTAESYKS